MTYGTRCARSHSISSANELFDHRLPDQGTPAHQVFRPQARPARHRPFRSPRLGVRPSRKERRWQVDHLTVVAWPAACRLRRDPNSRPEHARRQTIHPGRGWQHDRVAVTNRDDAAQLIRLTVDAGFAIHHAALERQRLEDQYFELIGQSATEGGRLARPFDRCRRDHRRQSLRTTSASIRLKAAHPTPSTRNSRCPGFRGTSIPPAPGQEQSLVRNRCRKSVIVLGRLKTGSLRIQDCIFCSRPYRSFLLPLMDVPRPER